MTFQFLTFLGEQDSCAAYYA